MTLPAPLAADPRYLAHVAPSARQLAWQRLEFYGFLHFGMNTMTGREWGDGSEDPALFDPTDVDADEWVRACRDAGMSAVILTCKHHDGFALWPTAHSDHSVASSPWRGGRGDLVREVADACRRHGLRFGVYLSPWDRAESAYGEGRAYDDFYVAQLTELLTGYGDVFCVWLDGANGEGPGGRRQGYDWDRYHRVVRALQPGAVISVCGPDVRWCGNEAGETRADEWSVVPWELRDAEGTASRSQKADDGVFSRAARSDEEDLGSREALAGYAGEPVWYPAEVNTSTRPGWFHHPEEDAMVRTAEELFRIHQRAVGGNSTFLLNVPPRRDGRLAPEDIASLTGLGALLREWEASDIASEGVVTCSTGEATLLDDPEIGWTPDVGDPEPRIRIDLPAPRTVHAVVVEERIEVGQRIESLEVVGVSGGRREVLARARSVGYRRILRFPATVVDAVEVTVLAARAAPVVSRVRVIEGPEVPA